MSFNGKANSSARCPGYRLMHLSGTSMLVYWICGYREYLIGYMQKKLMKPKRFNYCNNGFLLPAKISHKVITQLHIHIWQLLEERLKLIAFVGSSVIHCSAANASLKSSCPCVTFPRLLRTFSVSFS